MIQIKGLIGVRPKKESVERITCPPYDVIKSGTKLESLLQANEDSIYHITLGNEPLEALNAMFEKGIIQRDEEPCFYVYEQVYGNHERTGVLTATKVSDYKQGNIIRHEKTFDDKVQGRLKLRGLTGYTFEPVFLLTKSKIASILKLIKETYSPEYQFISDFAGNSELHGIKNRIFRVPENSEEGLALKNSIAEKPLYIADGHHRYHAALLNQQTHCLAYICEAAQAEIQAYNRVINGLVNFAEIKNKLDLTEIKEFTTPPKHTFAVYTKSGSYLLKVKDVPQDVVGKLDCSILEKELYAHLGLTHEMITDHRHFDYYSEADLEKMKNCVDAGKYDIAVGLHPVSSQELMDVADAGIVNPDIVMPEKSTFFAPKILSGLFIYKHSLR